MHGFVDFRELTDEEEESFGWPRAIYAIVESATPSEKKTEIDMSELLIPYVKEMGNGVWDDPRDPHQVPILGQRKRKFHMVDCDSIVDPTVLIPDIGNKDPAAYLRLRSKDEWADMFEEWLESSETFKG